jgi:hypothetical protein
MWAALVAIAHTAELLLAGAIPHLSREPLRMRMITTRQGTWSAQASLYQEADGLLVDGSNLKAQRRLVVRGKIVAELG